MKIRSLIVVPTYDNPATIADVVEGLLTATSLPVLVLDDGSQTPVQLPPNERLSIVRHSSNRGKGAAVQTAVTWALSHDFTHLITFDGDGQHLSADAVRLAKAANDHPWSLVIGARVFPASDVPGISRFGRNFSNFWIRYETGLSVSDSQSGLRVYPLFYMQGLKFLTRRYDFEVEALTRLLWADVPLLEVPVDVYYPPPEQRISHFRKGRDNVHITLLNIWFITLSLFRRHVDSRSLAKASLIAPLIAFLPLHPGLIFTLMAVVVVACQLNAWYAVAWFLAGILVPPQLFSRFGVNLWTPVWLCVPLVAVTLAASFHFGKRVGQPRRKTKAQWTGKTRGGRLGNLFLRVVSRWLGRGATYVCLAVITPYFYLFAPRARRSSSEYFAAMKPGLAWPRRNVHVLVHFFTFGMVLLDRLFQTFDPNSGLAVEVVTRKAVDAAAAGGRGVIVLTAHAGGWGLSTRKLASNLLGRKTVVAEFVANDPAMKVATAHDRPAFDRASIHNERSPILAYKDRLESGQIVAMMGDRPMTGKLALVPFMGKLAAFDTTPFRLAISLGVEVVYCFSFKKGYRAYELEFAAGPDLTAVLGVDKDQRCETALRHFTSALERQLRQHPHQWFNFYPFFSTKPVAPVALG